MPVSLKFLGVVAIVGAAPLPALAQPDAARDARSMQIARLEPTAQVTAIIQRPASRAHPARPLRLVVRDRQIPQVDVPVKDAWADDEGFQIRAAKVAYTRRF